MQTNRKKKKKNQIASTRSLQAFNYNNNNKKRDIILSLNIKEQKIPFVFFKKKNQKNIFLKPNAYKKEVFFEIYLPLYQ